MHIRSADGVLPAFGLDVHLLEAKSIERDDPVDTFVTYTTDAQQVRAAGAVAHCVQQIENEILEESRTGVEDCIQHFRCYRLANLQ